MGILSLREHQAQLPTPESTHSFWHTQPSEALLGHRTTSVLPPTADIVVIGSGITGAFAARELVAGGRRVLMLEAREACWGATGRNGGHCQPFLTNPSTDIARFELATYNYLRDLITTHHIPCDWHSIGGVQAIDSTTQLAAVEARLAALRHQAPDLASQVRLVTSPHELKQLRVPWAKAAVFQPNAAKCWPYKLVAWLLEALLRDGGGAPGLFNLQTRTPVERLQRVGEVWVLHTPRGQVAARDVVLATNAYTSHLLPGLTGLIVPVRGQVCALRPPEGDVLLEHSHVWAPEGSEDYLVQRDDEDGYLIMGGERLSTKDAGVGVSRDDTIDEHVGQKLRRALDHAVDVTPSTASTANSALTAAYEWTGIMGYSRDGHPWVGAVPAALGGARNLWIAAGFTGHGMPVAARCGVAVAEQVLGRTGGVELPLDYRVSEERVERAGAVSMGRAMGTMGRDWEV